MATDNKQKVLIRSMSYNELENYLVNSDLNGKIIPKNEDTWHQNYADAPNSGNNYACIVTNGTNLNKFVVFINRYMYTAVINSMLSTKNNIMYNPVSIGYGYSLPFCFRPLIEYKE